MMSICMGSVVDGVVVTDMVGDIGTGVVVVVYWTRAVGGSPLNGHSRAITAIHNIRNPHFSWGRICKVHVI